MLLDLASILMLFLFLISGYAIARLLLYERPIHERLLFGGSIGLLLLMWLPALFSFVFDFTVTSQLLAALIAAVIGGICFIRTKKHPCCAAEKPSYFPMLATLIPLFLIGAYLFFTHTIPQAADGSLHVGQSTFGDLSLHVGIVTSLKEQTTFPPEYSIYPGTAVGYPFLCDSISATFYVLGASLRLSMLLPALAAYAVVLLGVWCFFEQWLKKPCLTVLATLLFFIGGGFGFAYAFDLLKQDPGNLLDVFRGFYRTPTNQPDRGLLWVNPIADMLVPQRATLFGWSILFPCLTLLQRTAFSEELADRTRRKDLILLGCMAGCLPLIHTHSFLALGMVSAAYLFRTLWRKEWKRLPGWTMYAGTALILALPQLIFFTFRQAGGFLTFNFNWSNTRDSFLWFYIKNLGIIFLMLPISFVMAKKEDRGKYSGALLIWFFAEIIQFQPNPYDNNKLLFVWFAFTCVLAAHGLHMLYRKLEGLPGRKLIAAMTLTALFLSGSMTLAREAVSDYELIGSAHVEAAEFIKENTEADDLFLTSNNHNNAVAVLTGRNILCGTDSFLYFHGIDTHARREDMQLMFGTPSENFAELRAKYGIDYVYISSYERYDFNADEGYFAANYPLVFRNHEVSIYKVS
ncbi:MAG: hypothetical protein IJP37_04075 [Clostridia bacterium]|nr:hypothetical protein [Clostridia bacterium]